jgi:Arc/MetJ family transcription regulator
MAKVSISLDDELLQKAVARQKAFKYRKFSHYVTAAIEAELRSGATEHVRPIEHQPSALSLNERPHPPVRHIRKKQEN